MRTLAPWRPLGSTSVLHDDIGSVLSRFFGENEGRRNEGMYVPAIETLVRDGNLVVRVDLPGIKPDNVDLSVEGNRLTITGERKDEHESGDKGACYREVTYGRFHRTVQLPARIDADAVSATFKNGVLEVTLKAPSELVATKVPISVH